MRFSFDRQRKTDYQNAFLIALTHSEDDIIPTKQLLLLINKITAVNFPSVGDQSLTKIAGLRSGFKMRRVNKDDFIISYGRYEGKDKIIRYSIDPQYKDWIKDWVEQKGWILEKV